MHTVWYSFIMDFSIKSPEELRQAKAKKRNRFILAIVIMAVACFLFFFGELFLPVGNMAFQEAFLALFGQGKQNHIRIMQRILLTRGVGGLLVGAGLAISGLMMQTSLNNPMASPGTLGVSNAAVLGANIAIILLTPNPVNGTVWYSPSPYGVAGVAFLAAIISTVLVLVISNFKSLSPTTIILVGVGLGAGYQAITTLVQYFAADNTLASAVYWSFGDIGRLNPNDNWMLFAIISVAFAAFLLFSNRYDALLVGEDNATTLGVKVKALRLGALFFASLITAAIVSLCGIIGFVGIVAPHICRRIVGSTHRKLIPASLLMGAILVVGSDFLGRVFSNATSLPVGAMTAIIGAPFFLVLVISRKEVQS